jgi:hypothetical protein
MPFLITALSKELRYTGSGRAEVNICFNSFGDMAETVGGFRDSELEVTSQRTEYGDINAYQLRVHGIVINLRHTPFAESPITQSQE